MEPNGVHLLCEFSGCNPSLIGTVQAVQAAMHSAAQAAHATALNSYFHQFQPAGVTGFICLAESHMSIHSWPERSYAAVDIYTCGSLMEPARAIDFLKEALGAREVKTREVLRGLRSGTLGYTSADTSHDGVERQAHSAPAVEWYDEADADSSESHRFAVSEWLFRKESAWQEVDIFRNPGLGKILFLDGVSQSAERDEYIYHEALVHPGMLLHPDPRSVLILGGGEGASLREVLKHRTVERATMVDIDGELVQACRELLPEWSAGAYEDPRAELIIADGKEWVEGHEDRFDVVIMDLTDQVDLGPSFPLYTQDFLRTIRGRLNPGGMLVVQAGVLNSLEYFSHCTIRRTLGSVFPSVHSYTQYVPTFLSEWSFILASDEDLTPAQAVGRIDQQIAARLTKPLLSYDGVLHQRLFALPKDLRKALATTGEILTTREEFAATLREQREEVWSSAA